VTTVHAPRISYAASEYQTKPWLTEARIEGWFPPRAPEPSCFDATGQARFPALNSSTIRADSASAQQALARRVSEVDATRDHSASGKPDAGSQDPDIRRTVGVRLDFPTHRRSFKRSGASVRRCGPRELTESILRVVRS
jgi:hypothetical protein